MPGKGNLIWHPPFLKAYFSLLLHTISQHIYLLFLLFTDKLILVSYSQRREPGELAFLFILFLRKDNLRIISFILQQQKAQRTRFPLYEYEEEFIYVTVKRTKQRTPACRRNDR